MEEKFKVGNILEDTITKKRFKVIEINGDGAYAYITLLHLGNGLKYGNFANNITGLKLIKE